MPECAPFHNYLGEAHALLFILGHVAMERMGIFDFVLPGSKNSFRGRHFKKRYVSIRFPKIFSIRLRVPLVLSKILRTLLTTKSTLSTTYPTSITACTHSFHETMWLLTDLLSFSRKSLLKNAYTPSYSWTIRPKEGGKYFYRLSCHLSLSLSMHRRAVGFMRLS